MKNLTTIFSVLLLLTLFSSCKKNNTYETTFSDLPEALAKFDNAADSGLFRGVMIGSTGTLIINLGNFDGLFNATATIDGERFFFNLVRHDPNGAGTLMRADGGSTLLLKTINSELKVVSADIVGHPNAKFIIEKEFSNSRVLCYEGTYAGGDQGVINGIVYKEDFFSTTVSLSAIFMSNNDPQKTKFTADGTADANDIVVAGNASTGSTFTGKVKGSSQNVINGTWTNSNFNISGTFSCKRTF